MSETATVLLWGGKGSGKSGFLGALWHAGGAADDATGRWCISPGDIHDAVTKNYLIDAHTMLREGQRRATMPAPEYPSLRMTARKWVGGSPRAALDLSFTDPAGEYADDPRRAREQGGHLLDQLHSASGVVWLFDCLAENRPHLDQIIRQLGSLRQRTGGAAVDTPVALCLSRIDLLGPDVREWLTRDPEAALREALGDDVVAQIESAFPNRRYFAISSRGFAPDTVQPIGLNDVLSWIHANQRKQRAAIFARRSARPVAVAALLLLLVWAGARAAYQLRNGPGALERRSLLQRALGELELGGRLYAQGNHDSAFAVLQQADLPRSHERAVELDTLLAFAAHHLGSAGVLSGSESDSLLDVVLERTKRAARAVRDPAAAARVRYVHAEACMLRKCGEREIRDDLEYVSEHALDPQLVRQARDRLQELRR